MLTFLHYLSHRLALAVTLLLFLLSSGTDAQPLGRNTPLASASTVNAFTLLSENRKRIVTLRRDDTAEGARFTFRSDSPLDDYRFYVEGERLFVLIPRCALIPAHRDATGRGFADMRVEERNDEVLLSFRLQPGATVAVNQNFNRLDVVFITNERANSTI
jgi:hypothetical protein